MPVEEVVWDAPEHTKAKHQILRGYLNAWAPIMSQRSFKIRGRPPLYIDAFAGPGVYKDGSDGSPLVAIRAVLDHVREIPSPIRMNFIEADKERYEILKSKLLAARGLSQSRIVVENVMNTKCQNGLRDLVDAEKVKYGSFGPALVFLDQFGYSQAPMEMIQEIMSGDSCEALIYLDYQRMNHTLTDPNKRPALTLAFGSQEWEKACNLDGSRRVACLRNCYKKALTNAGAEYVWDFEMRGQHNELLSWLFFCTSNERGLEEMKKAMHRLDLTGNFRFSDRDVGQLNLLTKIFDLDWLVDNLYNQFGRKIVQHCLIRKFVLTETPLISYKMALRRLEDSNRIEVLNPPEGRRKGTFNFDDSISIEFVASPKGQTSLF